MIDSHRYQNGVITVWCDSEDTVGFCRAVAEQAKSQPIAIAMIAYSNEAHPPQDICSLLDQHAPTLNYVGCSSCGEVTPTGMQTSGAIATLFPERWFKVTSSIIENIDVTGIDAIAVQAAEQRTTFNTLTNSETNENKFAICLIDGLQISEEAVTSALIRGLGEMPIIGASAGDDFAFTGTTQMGNGKVYKQAAVLVLFHCTLPFCLYSENNFVPTKKKFVVTECDPENRVVYEFNAEPAAIAYANAIGTTPAELTASDYATHSVAVKAGGEYYCRSIQKVNADNSITFFCAIDNGLVLTVARSENMLASTREAIHRIRHSIGPIGLMFGFDCVYRKLDATHRNIVPSVEELYRQNHFIGFNSYGEQFRSMHINQTFTGVAIGIPEWSP